MVGQRSAEGRFSWSAVPFLTVIHLLDHIFFGSRKTYPR
jgi:hypothetical protein